jgi:hypothetical protein
VDINREESVCIHEQMVTRKMWIDGNGIADIIRSVTGRYLVGLYR